MPRSNLLANFAFNKILPMKKIVVCNPFGITNIKYSVVLTTTLHHIALSNQVFRRVQHLINRFNTTRKNLPIALPISGDLANFGLSLRSQFIPMSASITQNKIYFLTILPLLSKGLSCGKLNR